MISGIFGLPGSGKSVYLAKCAKYALDGRPVRVGGHTLHHGDYDNVFTNFPVKGCKQLEWSRLGKVEIRNALLICDEIMMYADSRQYKNFSDDLTFFFAEHRKFNIDFIWASQTYRDCDLRIRNLTQHFYFCEPAPVFGNKFTVISPITSNFKVRDGDIKEGYELAPVIQRGICYMPKYWNLYDTNELIGHGKLEKYQPVDW